MQSSIDIGHGLQLTLEADGRWRAIGPGGSWPVESRGDYFRVVTLLEKSYAEVVLAIGRITARNPTAQPFLLEAVVMTGLQSSSDYWASLAMAWVGQLPEEKRKAFADVLRTVSTAKWAGQKLRQAAKRNLKPLPP